ncbi:MAG TPA: DeoR/GlpR family DNA-binding transcription regulator [Bryobacteraceae bacterium]|nr:DeoR/GlpR family DNA-binding transcription regulator [Bryobacteraceae bacterium]HOQ45977.1 DeoR/GlpR family DNA-binding transcription regulator [Bryobacteraceae bacterium]HPQ14323.1 DeoR/GlpR family DNA-binding transcription regulator [Bryobacteraceae bacterium]HPU73812.1 DeoR/GlpR family DNA-binding transcription regulator [Bryobacteraceae bacterium]
MIATKSGRLLLEERRRKIVELVTKEGRITVEEIAQRFGVSSVTARADLDALAKSGALVRSHGGAVSRLDPVQDYPVSFKETLHHAEKVRIGQAAAKLLQPNQTVIIDSGTTTLEIARHLKVLKIKGLMVITNALNIATELAGVPNLSLIMIGGILRPVSSSFVGPQAERMLADLYADHSFLGVDGLDPEVGPTTPDILEAQLNSQMVRVSREVTIVADASKIGRRSLSPIASLSSIRRLITDSRIDPDLVRIFQNKGLEVIVV